MCEHTNVEQYKLVRLICPDCGLVKEIFVRENYTEGLIEQAIENASCLHPETLTDERGMKICMVCHQIIAVPQGIINTQPSESEMVIPEEGA